MVAKLGLWQTFCSRKNTIGRVPTVPTFLFYQRAYGTYVLSFFFQVTFVIVESTYFMLPTLTFITLNPLEKHTLALDTNLGSQSKEIKCKMNKKSFTNSSISPLFFTFSSLCLKIFTPEKEILLEEDRVLQQLLQKQCFVESSSGVM